MNFHKELKDLNLWARYYTANGINTPLTDIDVEIVKLNQKWNVFLLSYTEQEKSLSITMLLKTDGATIGEAITKAVEHFHASMKSAPADDSSFLEWETSRVEAIKARKLSNEIKEVKDSIFKEDKDIFRGLL